MGRGLDGYFCDTPRARRRGTACAAVLKGRRRRVSQRFSGGYGERETPLPIPNRAVKPLSADGTWLARARESRTPPVYLVRRAVHRGRPFVVLLAGSGGALGSGSGGCAAPRHRAGAVQFGSAATHGAGARSRRRGRARRRALRPPAEERHEPGRGCAGGRRYCWGVHPALGEGGNMCSQAYDDAWTEHTFVHDFVQARLNEGCSAARCCGGADARDDFVGELGRRAHDPRDRESGCRRRRRRGLRRRRPEKRARPRGRRDLRRSAGRPRTRAASPSGWRCPCREAPERCRAEPRPSRLGS